VDDDDGVAQNQLWGHGDVHHVGQEGVVQLPEGVMRRSQVAQSRWCVGMGEDRSHGHLVLGQRRSPLHPDDGTVVGHHQGGTRPEGLGHGPPDGEAGCRVHVHGRRGSENVEIEAVDPAVAPDLLGFVRQ
jgi:hypothetical protein